MIGGGPQKITVEIGGKVAASLGASLRSAQMQVSSFGRNVNRTMNDAATAGKKGFKNIFSNDLWQGAAAGAAGIGLALAGSVKVAASFETALTEIGKTANVSQSELKGVSAELLRLSGRNLTNLGPQKLAEGVQDLVAQGLELKDAVASMESLGKVATATNSDLLDVTKTGFQLQNALKIRPTELKATFDALAYAGKQGAFELKDMAQFMPTIAAAAGTMGIQGKQGAIALASMMQMVRKDAPDAGQAATRLTDAMLKMTAPDAVKRFKKFGVDIEQVMKTARAKGVNPMEAAISELQRVTGGDAFKLGQIFGDKEAKLALLSLMKYRKEYEQLKREAGGSEAAGTVDRDFQKQIQTFAGTLASFQNVSQRLGIALGNALLPTLTALAAAITPLAEGFASFAQLNPVIATGLVTIAGGFAGLVVAAPFVSSMISIVGALGSAITAAGGAGVVFGGVMAAITGPIGLTVLAIAGIGTALVLAYQKVESFRDGVNAVFSGIGSIFSGAVEQIKGAWTMLVGIFTGDSRKISEGFNQMLGGLGRTWAGVGQILQGVWRGVVGGAQAMASGVVNAILSLPQLVGNVFSGILQVGRMVFARLPQPVQSAVKTMLGILFPIPTMVVRNWGAIVTGVRGIFSRVVALIRETPQRVANVGRLVIDAILNGLRGRVGALFSWVGGAWDRIKGMVGGGGGENAAAAPAARPAASEPDSPYRGGQRSATPPGRAMGGPVRAGFPYIVGERRRELFVPGMDGAIIPKIARPITAGAIATMLSTQPVMAAAPAINLAPQVAAPAITAPAPRISLQAPAPPAINLAPAPRTELPDLQLPAPPRTKTVAPVTIHAPVTINAGPGADAMEIRRQVEIAFADIQRQIESSHRVLLND